MSKRRNTALAVLALAAAAVFVLPASSASAGTATVPNACANSVTANFSQIGVTTSGTDGVDLPATVPGGGATTTSGLTQSAAIPGAIFVAGYNLGLLVVGPNNIPANVRSTIEATNTAAPSVQNTNTVGGTPPNGTVTVSTVITDPDGTPGTGDESATDASFSVAYNNLSWTASGPDGSTIDYRQESIPAAPPTSASNTLLINALVGGFLTVTFRCAPGTVAGMNPGVITLIDPAASFDTTQIGEVESQISIDDQTVTEGGAANFTVSLDAPQAAPVTVDFATANGTAVAPGDYTSATGTVTFAPGDTSETVTVQTIDDADVEATETFDVNLSNATGNAAILDGLGVGTILDNDQPVGAVDAAAEVIVKGKVHAKQDRKVYFLRVTNLGESPITVNPDTDIDASVEVNGTPSGSVEALTGTKTIKPGHRKRFPLRWTQDGTLASGDSVEFIACVNLAGDTDTTNDCDSVTRTAR